MTEEKKKKSVGAKLVYGFIAVLYYTVWCFAIVFPFLLLGFIVPEVTGFLTATGMELHPITVALINYSYLCGSICTVVNIGLPLWRFFVKPGRTDIFSKKHFFWWLLITNFILILWVIEALFGTTYYGYGKM